MTVDEMARRLEAAAAQLLSIQAELADHEFVLDRAGKSADELAGLLGAAWAQHQQLSGWLAGSIVGLSTAVGVAAENYRATDGERF